MTYQAKFIKEGSWCVLLQNLSTVSTFISRRGDWPNGDRSNEKYKWVYLMAYQAKLIEEGSW